MEGSTLESQTQDNHQKNNEANEININLDNCT